MKNKSLLKHCLIESMFRQRLNKSIASDMTAVSQFVSLLILVAYRIDGFIKTITNIYGRPHQKAVSTLNKIKHQFLDEIGVETSSSIFDSNHHQAAEKLVKYLEFFVEEAQANGDMENCVKDEIVKLNNRTYLQDEPEGSNLDSSDSSGSSITGFGIE